MEVRVLQDVDTLYFNVKTRDNLSDPSDDGWMTIFLSTGKGETWAGVWDLAVNRLAPHDGVTLVEHRTAEGWETIGSAEIRVAGKDLMIALKKALLKTDSSEIAFKVADHYEQDNVMSFYTVGDCAPYGRMNFVFTMKEL